MKNYIIFIIAIIPFVFVGCTDRFIELDRKVTITEISPTLDISKTNYDINTRINDTSVNITNQIISKDSRIEQNITFDLIDKNKVIATIETDNYNGDILLFSDKHKKQFETEQLNSIRNSDLKNYINLFSSFSVKENSNVFSVNFNRNLEIININKTAYNLTHKTSIIYLNIRENLKNLKSDISNLLRYENVDLNDLNFFFHVFINHDTISLHSFAERDSVELYAYLISLNGNVNTIDYSFALLFQNILSTLSKLIYLIDSPTLEG